MSSAGGAEGDEEETPVSQAVDGARGSTGRRLAWVVGGILGVAGAVLTITDLVHNHHGIGPYLLAAGFLLGFLAALDMWRAERSKARTAVRTVRRLTARVERQEGNVQHLGHDRDAWMRMQGEEVAANRRLAEDFERLQQPRVSGGTVRVASTGPVQLPIFKPAEPPPTPRPPPRHSRRRPPENQPGLFDQDEA